ncbi:hypothetical protein G5C60_36385 [Streptomyces sp. HC44]|uniref:XRE family transcriptional regulator n=1 Tax=Streptomyces scabichelini TaxID=2711217 RepID=A0A6G4VGM9_9ACTN|nr:hypothetical protein [Streptomyces scabichelini]NGO12933.1 hypothetical protein [Streptomyces scabichelini]
MTTAPPTPPHTDAAAFVAALRRLKAWSGLSYRRLERHAADAGHSLPYSTAATMLGRERLPREELVVAFVAACGVREAEAEAWVDARTTIACGHVNSPLARDRVNSGPKRSWRSRWAFVGAAALVTALLGGAVASGAVTDDQEVQETRTSLRL